MAMFFYFCSIVSNSNIILSDLIKSKGNPQCTQVCMLIRLIDIINFE